METLYIIVHKGVVEACAKSSPEARKCHKKIQEIINHEKYLEINGNPNAVHPDMPARSKDLTVLVCGAMTTCCVEKQKSTLFQLDYNVRLYHEACYQQYGSRI